MDHYRSCRCLECAAENADEPQTWLDGLLGVFVIPVLAVILFAAFLFDLLLPEVSRGQTRQ